MCVRACVRASLRVILDGDGDGGVDDGGGDDDDPAFYSTDWNISIYTERHVSVPTVQANTIWPLSSINSSILSRSAPWRMSYRTSSATNAEA